MNDVYGIDPVAPSDFRDFAFLMSKFEVDQGRFIADFPDGDWWPSMSARLKDLSPLDGMRAAVLWERVARSAMVPVSGKYNRSWSWPENANTIHEQVVKSIGAKGCPATLESIESALLNPDAFPDASSGHIPRTAVDYAKVARPLLQTSPKIVLVDPHFKLKYFDERIQQFRPSIRHRKSLEALLRESVKWKRVETFRLVVSEKGAFAEDNTGDAFQADLEQLVSSCSAASLQLEIDVLDPHSSDKHPRYLLGMNRGLHFDWGFDTDPTANTTNHIEWIGKSALQPLLKWFT